MSSLGRCIVFAAAVSGIGCVAAGSPRPAPVPTAEPAAPIEPLPRGTSHFAYAAGTHAFEVRNEASIEMIETGARDSLVSTTYLTYTLAPAGEEFLVVGRVDSFTVAAGDSVPRPPHETPFPIAFTAWMDVVGHVREFSSPDTSTCGSAAGALLGVARELLITTPSGLGAGLEWSDTTSTSACRGDIPMTVTSVRHHRVAQPVDSSGSTLLRIVRETNATISGTGERSVQATTVSGTGTGTMEILLDPVAGILAGARGESVTMLTYDAASRRETFRQRVRIEIRRTW